MLKTPSEFIALTSPHEDPNPLTFIFRGDELMVRESDLRLPDISTCEAMQIPSTQLYPLGLLNNRYCRTSWLAKDVVPAKDFAFKKLRSLFGTLDEETMALAGRAYQIAEWARTHQFCGVCAAPMQMQHGERCFQCATCSMIAYPRISPAMMVLIKKGEAVLLARHAAHVASRFTALAGFVEVGESIEETVHREVFEEVGLRINNLRYFGSQSWPFPHSLMIAFTADYVSGDITLNPAEIAEARWFSKNDELPLIAPSFSIAGSLIQAHLSC